MDPQEILKENIAATLARVLPTAAIISAMPEDGSDRTALEYIAVPKNFSLEMIDFEPLLANPRRTKAVATFSGAESFVNYVEKHKQAGTTVWCKFDPQTFALSFTAVLDEHAAGTPGWREHRAEFTPDMSTEWKAWKGKNTASFPQVAFAEWIEEHADNIAAPKNPDGLLLDGFPTGLQMLDMATNFVANEERVLKSTVRLQSGGIRLTYIADPDAGTTESMDMFKQFAIGIPVFQDGAFWRLDARLKYAQSGGKVSFRYELIRADRVHNDAALDVVKTMREALGEVPLLMGTCR